MMILNEVSQCVIHGIIIKVLLSGLDRHVLEKGLEKDFLGGLRMSSQYMPKVSDIGEDICTEKAGHHLVKVLVIVETYPLPNGEVRTSNYFHERNKYYKANGIQVKVLNFSAKNHYVLDNIEVINATKWKEKESLEKYDVLISHAPNVKHHLPFLKKYESKFKHILFFFHGQEVLKISKVYPKPYTFLQQSGIKKIARNMYDDFKFAVWRSYFPKIARKADFVFVSESLRDQFFDGIRIKREVLEGKSHIISNGIGKEFEGAQFDYECNKEYDFITIRSNMDSSTYCIDILTEIARRNPEYRFLLIGEGQYYKHFSKPENIEIINTTLSHAELIDYLQKSRVALMLTRNDTQGVMSCEISSIGMPLITSDIKVCREIFSCFPNVILVENDPCQVNLTKIVEKLERGLPYERVKKYYSENTVKKEADIIYDVMQR